MKGRGTLARDGQSNDRCIPLYWRNEKKVRGFIALESSKLQKLPKNWSEALFSCLHATPPSQMVYIWPFGGT